MRGIRYACALACAAAMVAASVSPALAQNWSAMRDAAPTAKEHGAPAGMRALVRAAEASGPDSFEPDESMSGASALLMNARTAIHNFYTAFDPSTGELQDDDWFSFTAEAGHTYQFAVQLEGASVGTYDIVALELDDAAGNPLAATLYRDWWADEGGASSLCWTAPASGTYYIDAWDWVESFANDAHSVEYSIMPTDLGVVAPGTVQRVGGADRYEVAASLARNSSGTYAGVTHIIIASGLDKAMADALSASGLAGTVGGPVLLVRADRAYLPAPTKAAIQGCVAANPGATIQFHIVGGPASVPVGLEKQMRLAAPRSTIERLSGIDRYAVAANVAAHIRKHAGTGYTKIAFVVNGQNASYFSDALAASPAAAGLHAPILLVKSTVIPPATATALKSYPHRIMIGIPEKALYRVVGNALDATTPDNGSLAWVDGWSRDTIARHFAEFWEGDMTPSYDYVVTNKLSDALTAGSAPQLGYNFVLYTNAHVDAYGLTPLGTDTFVQIRRANAPLLAIIGGEASVGPDVAARLGRIVGN